MKVYLAGPDVFHPKGAELGERKKEICRRYGLIGFFPLDNEVAGQLGESLSRSIFLANTRLMEEADAVIANLTPFRGPSADVGTAYELGYMAGCGKLCFGYSNLPGTYLARAAGLDGAVRDSASGRHVDENGLFIESFPEPFADNLMIVHALDFLGHSLIVPETRPKDIWLDLSAFETCVSIAARGSAIASDERLRHVR